MRGAIIVFVLGVIAGAIGLNYLKQQRSTEDRLNASTSPHVGESPTLVDHARDAAVTARDSVSDKLRDWNLSGSEIKDDLERTGRVVRTKARSAGETIATAAGKAKVIGTIKTKYALDKELSARSVEIDYDEGKVTLRGVVPSEALLGKAVALALDTEGVHEVQSLLTVPQPEAP